MISYQNITKIDFSEKQTYKNIFAIFSDSFIHALQYTEVHKNIPKITFIVYKVLNSLSKIDRITCKNPRGFLFFFFFQIRYQKIVLVKYINVKPIYI